jgi:ketosteroid isomerase-like protein
MQGAEIRKMFASIDAMDWATLQDLLHPEVVYERPGFEPLVGSERVMRFYRVERAITRSTHHIEGVVTDDGRGAAWGKADCELADGRWTTIGFAEIYHLANGLIRLRRTHFYVPAV